MEKEKHRYENLFLPLFLLKNLTLLFQAPLNQVKALVQEEDCRWEPELVVSPLQFHQRFFLEEEQASETHMCTI